MKVGKPFSGQWNVAIMQWFIVWNMGDRQVLYPKSPCWATPTFRITDSLHCRHKKAKRRGKVAQWKRDLFSPQSPLLSPPHLRPVTQARSQRSCLTETSTVIPLKPRVFKNHFLTLLYENEGGNKIGSIEQVRESQLGLFLFHSLGSLCYFWLWDSNLRIFSLVRNVSTRGSINLLISTIFLEYPFF